MVPTGDHGIRPESINLFLYHLLRSGWSLDVLNVASVNSSSRHTVDFNFSSAFGCVIDPLEEKFFDAVFSSHDTLRIKS